MRFKPHLPSVAQTEPLLQQMKTSHTPTTSHHWMQLFLLGFFPFNLPFLSFICVTGVIVFVFLSFKSFRIQDKRDDVL